ncbi:MAG: GlsB/YeaQ/YmgE family stress response membrane protein [Acidimicrobiia bacterium]
MDWLSTLIGALIGGIIIGPLARLVLPGKQNISMVMTILIGAAGALLGGLIADWVGVGDTSGIDWIKLAIQVAVAAVLVLIYGSMAGRTAGGTTATTGGPPPQP